MNFGAHHSDLNATSRDLLAEAASPPPIIRVSNLYKSFQSGDALIEAVRGVSLSLAPGSCLFLVGPSGSGKSTLLYLLGALDEPTSGTIEIDGEELTLMNETERDLFRRRKVGFIFQQFNLISHLTALGNVLMPFIPNGITPELEQRARQRLAEVGLANRLSHRPSKLSGGQQQRVAIARALLKDPVVLLADEPTGKPRSQERRRNLRPPPPRAALTRMHSGGRDSRPPLHSTGRQGDRESRTGLLLR